MRTAQALNEIVRWRWMPFAAIVGASTIYVVIVALAVPDHIDFMRTPRSRTRMAEQAQGPAATTTGETMTSEPTSGSLAAPDHQSPLPAPAVPAQNFGPRGFSPVERPDIPAPPPPPPTPPQEATLVNPPPPTPPSQPDDDTPAAPAPAPPSEVVNTARNPMRILGRQVQQLAGAVGRDSGGAGGAAPAPPTNVMAP